MTPHRLQRVARQHLEFDRLMGVAFTPVAEAAPAVVAQEPVEARVPAATAPPPTVARPARESAPRAAPPRPAPAAVGSPALSAVPLRDVAPGDRTAALAEVRARLAEDPAVAKLQPPGTKIVFGEGSPTADIAFIGEGPGETEDRLGRPFVGKAGQLLEKMVTAMGFAREEVYITNAVNFRPPGNRAPTPEETAACLPYLLEQLAVVRPKAAVLLGGSAARVMLDTKTGITRLRGSWQSIRLVDPPLKAMPTFHPAFLLRSYTVDNRKKVWSDLQAVLAETEGA
ncbi:MAG: uracil-DNA glycosylase [Planctomycetota bacterium]